MPNKITIIGTSGVGKTTLSQHLAAKLDIVLIPELAREICAQMGYRRIGEIPDQEGFKRKVLEQQIEHEKKFESFVADRSTIDTWVLWQRWNICQAMTYDTEAIYEKCKSHAGAYTHIIYVPPLFEPVDDGFRWVEPDYVKQIDRIIRMTLYDFDLWSKVYTITSSDLELRLAEILTWLQK